MTRRARTPTLARGSGWFASPFVLGVILLLVLPSLLNVGYALTNYTGVGRVGFTGFGNVRRALSDPFFFASLRASLIFVVFAVPLRLLVATTVGLALSAPRRGNRMARALVYLPTVLPDIALSLVFLWLANPVYGPINQILGAAGLPQPIWLSTPWGARAIIVVMMLFPIGEAFLVVLTARQSLNRDLYDAAGVDGASAWQQLRYVTLPQMAPLLLLLAIRDTILTLQVNFVPAYLLTDGGPDNATLFLPVYIYDQAFEFLGFGYGAMLSVLLGLVTAGLILIQVIIVGRWRPIRDIFDR